MKIITSMGTSSHELVQKAWNGKDLSNINLFLSTSSSMLSQLTAQHKAYPILHFYHAESKEKEASYAIAALEDALTIMKEGIERGAKPNFFS